ncbi:Ser-Thr-rich glycosyl-phosphatidyl-inositol-anchored membrane family-domain-containing protein [Xylariaceae sp. FL0016]|nr:Ser-Thr-rich glycosyl-phosphatidyl-inositol-anchored membrane family-domain-containing protein [Xylariaceae sp. FL0016]
MRSAAVVASVLAFAASTMAQVPGFAVMTSPANEQTVEAGETFTIVWQPGAYTGSATIELIGGATQNTQIPLKTLATIDLTTGSYAWAVDCSLGDAAVYGLKIVSTANTATFQYSFPFHIDSCSDATTSSSSTSSASSSTSVVVYPASSTSESSAYPAYPTASSAAPVYPTGSASTSMGSVYPTWTSSAAPYPTTFSSMVGYNATTMSSAPATSGAVTATSVKPSTTASSTPIATAAAAKVGAGSMAVLGLFAAMLL